MGPTQLAMRWVPGALSLWVKRPGREANHSPQSSAEAGLLVRVPAGAGNFSVHHRVQIGSGAHPVSYPMDTRGSFSEGKAAGA
jgi:hypothetical protein